MENKDVENINGAEGNWAGVIRCHVIHGTIGAKICP